MNKKRLIIIPIILLAILANYIYQRGDLWRKSFRYAGTIEATTVDVSARISSVIAEVNVKEGDLVTQNESLLELACEDTRLAAQLADRNFARNATLYRQGSSPQEVYDQMKNKKDSADLMLSWCSVLAPLNATVFTKYHEAGEMVGPGTKLFTLANLADVYAYIYVAETAVSRLKLGQTVSGYLDDPRLKTKALNGKMVHIADQAEFTPKNVQTQQERERLVYAVKIAFDNPEQLLKPGMSIEVELPN